GFADFRAKPVAPATHLGVFDGGSGRAQHNQIFNLFVVVAGVEHIYGNGDNRQRVELETVNDWLGMTVIGVARNFLREALADFGGGAIRLLRDAKTGG